jgi:hypothetical protein
MWLGLTGLLLCAGLLRWQLARHFVSEPPYEVLERLGDGVEIRRYEAMVVAETRIEASFDAAPNQGFRRLAGFLFGGNRGGESLAMTAPVTQTGERLAMTVPVTQAVTGAASVVAFVMPAGRALSSLPIPDDGSVALREVPARTIAVLTYSGSTDERTVAVRTAELEAALARAGRTPRGVATSARYDPPSTLPILRRNEIWLEL